MKEHDKFTKLLLQDNLKKEKNWDNRFVLEKIPQYDAFKDPNYLSLSLMKTKTKLEEKNNSKNKQTNQKRPIYSSHYSINSLSKKIPSQAKINYEDSFNNKNSAIDNKRPKSIYLNRNHNNHLSFMNNINNSNSNRDTSKNKNIFYNFISNKLKTQFNNTNINSNKDFYTTKLTSKTTKNSDIGNVKKFIEFKQSSYDNLEKDLLNDLKPIKEIWNEICVTPSYQNSFEEMLSNLKTKEEIENILNNEKKQILQFKNELIKLMKVISKRESIIENIKKLDKIYIQNKELAKLNKIYSEKNKSAPNLNTNDEIIYNYEKLEEKNKVQIEDDINNCLKLLRINSVNAVHQFNKFRSMNNYIITSNKIDIEKLKKKYGYRQDYLIKLKNDLDFLTFSNINLFYNFKTNDPFLLSLVPEKNINEKFKKIPISEELMITINNYLYILAQEELLFKIRFKKEIKRNKTNEFEQRDNKDDSNIKNIINKRKKNIQKEFNKLFFKTNKNNDITDNNINSNRIKKIKNLYFNNQIKNKKNEDNEKYNEIPITSAAKLQKNFDFYNKLKNDLINDKNEIKNEINNDDNKDKKDNTKSEKKLPENNENKNNRDNSDKKIEDKFNFIWFTDNFNKFKNLYNEYYNKLSKKTIELFSLDKNAENIICGMSPKIGISLKDNTKIYGVCGIGYYYDNIDNKLILKINHLGSLEKDEDEPDNTLYQKEKFEFKIYDHFIELVKNLNYQIIELNLYTNDNNNDILNYFINKYKFEIKDDEKQKENNENNNMEGEKNNENDIQDKNILKKKILRIYNNNFNINDENIKKLKESNEIRYNNTSILSLIEDNDNDNNNNNNNIECEKDITNFNQNKYFYKYINTFNLNILIKILTKDNIYNLINTSNENNSFLEDISKYSSLFIKEQNNNLDNIINISPDSLLIETKDKIKYSYITSMLNTKIMPYISTLYNKKIYNIFKINLSEFNKEKKIYIIPSSEEKISFYIYQCEEDSDIKKEINKNNDDFNIFEYFNKLINPESDNEKDKKNDDEEYKFEENGENKKLLWIPSFNIDTQLLCNKIPTLKNIIIKDSNGKKFDIKEYNEILKISFGTNELNSNTFMYEPNLNEDIIIEKDFILAISHKEIKNQFNNSIAFLIYITKDNFINSK